MFGGLKQILFFHRYLKGYFSFFLFALFFTAVAVLLSLLAPLLTRVLFDYAYPLHSLQLLNVCIMGIVAIYISQLLLGAVSDYLELYAQQEATHKLMYQLYQHLQELPLAFHQEKSSGDLMHRLTEDVGNSMGMIMSLLPTLLIDGGRFVVVLLLAFYMNPKLTLLATLAIPLYILETKFFAHRLQSVKNEAIDSDTEIMSLLHEKIPSIRTIKAFGQETQEALSFSRLVQNRFKIGLKERLLEITHSFSNSLTLQMWGVFLTWYLGYNVVVGKLSIGEIVALMLYLEMLGDPIKSFIHLFTSWKTNVVSMQRVREVFSNRSELKKKKAEKELEVTSGAISTKALSFEYQKDEHILEDLNVQFPAKSLTAIVGQSGAGKSTLVNLLMRFFEPSLGAIFIDQQNICEVSVNSLRNHIGMIAQDFNLFKGTVLENILYGNESRTEADAIDAARFAGAYDFIQKLPHGIHSQVGFAGELLSGGQRQRVAIARTLLRDPDLIIFDEATSALDSESELKIQETILKLRQHKTVIVIAHRLSTIKTADNILVLEDGHLKEQGSFEELLAKKEAFYRYYWNQFGGLSHFKQQLDQEFERSVRYRSQFSLAMLQILNYKTIAKNTSFAADQLMHEVDFALKKLIRLGDNIAYYKDGLFLFLLPEIDDEHLNGFFARMSSTLPSYDIPSLGRPLNQTDLRFCGAAFKGKLFKNSEFLLQALERFTQNDDSSGSYQIEQEVLMENYEN